MTLSLVVLLAGIIVWFAGTRPREKKRWVESWAAEAGKIAYAAGLLAYLIANGVKNVL